jgi:hypothetical protein
MFIFSFLLFLSHVLFRNIVTCTARVNEIAFMFNPLLVAECDYLIFKGIHSLAPQPFTGKGVVLAPSSMTVPRHQARDAAARYVHQHEHATIILHKIISTIIKLIN